MLAATLLLLVQVCESTDNTNSPGGFLARHQMKDGTWGRVPEGCRCPNRLPDVEKIEVPKKDRKKIDEWIGTIHSGSLEAREKAVEELVKFGKAALPQLSRAAESDDAEVRARIREAIRRIVRAEQITDLRITSLALLNWLAAGYSHLSADRIGGRKTGDMIKQTLRWLLKLQEKGGGFGSDDPTAEAMAALALSEAYGLTGTALFKDQAVLALKYIESHKESGTEFLLWKGLVQKSGELSGLVGNRQADHAVLSLTLAGRKGTLALAGSVLFAAYADRKQDEARVARLVAFDPKQLRPEERHFVTLAVYSVGGPKSPEWKGWGRRLKEALLNPDERYVGKKGCNRGSWKGKRLRDRLNRTVHNSLTLKAYYRFASALSDR